jgi:putative salt-induced outer membrane protein
MRRKGRVALGPPSVQSDGVACLAILAPGLESAAMRQGVELVINRMHASLLGLGLLAACLPAHADWSGKAELGGSFASGNSDNEAANAAAVVKYVRGPWSDELAFSGNYGSSGGETTAQRWEVRGQSSYDFTPKAYWFGAGRYDDDRFSAYDYQGSLATGLGYRFINTDKTKFWVQGGPGYRVSKERDTGDTIDGLIFRGDLGFDQQLTGNTKIVERFLIETGSDNTYLQNNLGLEVMMSGALGLRIGYEVRYNTDVPPGIEKTDTLTTIGLLYESK